MAAREGGVRGHRKLGHLDEEEVLEEEEAVHKREGRQEVTIHPTWTPPPKDPPYPPHRISCRHYLAAEYPT